MSHTVGGPADHAQGGQAVRQHDPRKARRALIGAGVGAAVGMSAREPGTGLQAAWERADLSMYAAKHQRACSREALAGNAPA